MPFEICLDFKSKYTYKNTIDSFNKITHKDSPYAVHASIRKDDTKHEIYISDKGYDGDVTSLYNLNEGYVSYGSCLAQEISFMLRTIVMNAELFNNKQYSTFVITIQDKTKTVNQNFISLVVETIADVAKLTLLNSNLPVMTSLYNSKVILKVLLPDGSQIFIEPA